jgi:hypothetical protein
LNSKITRHTPSNNKHAFKKMQNIFFDKKGFTQASPQTVGSATWTAARLLAKAHS